MKIFAEYVLYPIWQAILGVIAGTAILVLWSFIMTHIDKIEAMNEESK